MIAYIPTGKDPYYNLAVEEFFLKNDAIEKDILLLWQNDHTIVIGKNQNAYNEINEHFVKTNGITLARRLSGGGAVYHDLGNLNFTIIKQDAEKYQNDFSFFTKPVVETLQSLGLPASFSGRNDILLDGKKISGNAQYHYKHKQLNHGTMLFDTDLSVLSKALTPRPEKYTSHGVKSVESRVTNIKAYDENLTLEVFSEKLLTHFFPKNSPDFYTLSPTEIKSIEALRDEKYAKWEWIYGKSPAMDIVKTKRFQAGTVEIHFSVKKGSIVEILITGDFFEIQSIDILIKALTGASFKEAAIHHILGDTPIETVIHNLTSHEFMDLLFS